MALPTLHMYSYLEEVVVVLDVEGRPLEPRDEDPQRVQDVRHSRHRRRRNALLLLKYINVLYESNEAGASRA